MQLGEFYKPVSPECSPGAPEIIPEKPLVQQMGFWPLQPQTLASGLHDWMMERAQTDIETGPAQANLDIVDFVGYGSAILDVGTMAALGALQNVPDKATTKWVRHAFQHVGTQLEQQGGPQFMAELRKAIREEGSVPALKHYAFRELDIAHSMLQKFQGVIRPATGYLDQFLRNPRNVPGDSCLIKPMKRIANAGGLLVVEHNNIRRELSVGGKSEGKEALSADMAGSLTEADAAWAIADLIRTHHLGLWLVPTGCLFERTREAWGLEQARPGLDYILIAPHIEQAYGVQVKTKLEAAETIENYPGVFVIDGATDLANMSGNGLKPGGVVASAFHIQNGFDIHFARTTGGEVIDFAHQPRSIEESKRHLQLVRQQLGNRLLKFAPEIFEKVEPKKKVR